MGMGACVPDMRCGPAEYFVTHFYGAHTSDQRQQKRLLRAVLKVRLILTAPQARLVRISAHLCRVPHWISFYGLTHAMFLSTAFTASPHLPWGCRPRVIYSGKADAAVWHRRRGSRIGGIA